MSDVKSANEVADEALDEVAGGTGGYAIESTYSEREYLQAGITFDHLPTTQGFAAEYWILGHKITEKQANICVAAYRQKGSALTEDDLRGLGII